MKLFRAISTVVLLSALAFGATTSKQLTLKVNPAPLTITTTSLPDAQVGVAYSATITATGGVAPYTCTATGLPAGLTLNTTTCTISGTPTAYGSFNLTITVTDAQGTSVGAVAGKVAQ